MIMFKLFVQNGIPLRGLSWFFIGNGQPWWTVWCIGASCLLRRICFRAYFSLNQIILQACSEYFLYPAVTAKAVFGLSVTITCMRQASDTVSVVSGMPTATDCFWKQSCIL